MRKKMNKADAMYIEANLSRPVSDISQEIDLDQSAIAAHIKAFKPPKQDNLALKNSRITSNGETIGAQLTDSLADESSAPKSPKPKKEHPNIYRTR